jgi:hypothetical protein
VRQVLAEETAPVPLLPTPRPLGYREKAEIRHLHATMPQTMHIQRLADIYRTNQATISAIVHWTPEEWDRQEQQFLKSVYQRALVFRDRDARLTQFRSLRGLAYIAMQDMEAQPNDPKLRDTWIEYMSAFAEFLEANPDVREPGAEEFDEEIFDKSLGMDVPHGDHGDLAFSSSSSSTGMNVSSGETGVSSSGASSTASPPSTAHATSSSSTTPASPSVSTGTSGSSTTSSGSPSGASGSKDDVGHALKRGVDAIMGEELFRV